MGMLVDCLGQKIFGSYQLCLVTEGLFHNFRLVSIIWRKPERQTPTGKPECKAELFKSPRAHEPYFFQVAVSFLLCPPLELLKTIWKVNFPQTRESKYSLAVCVELHQPLRLKTLQLLWSEWRWQSHPGSHSMCPCLSRSANGIWTWTELGDRGRDQRCSPETECHQSSAAGLVRTMFQIWWMRVLNGKFNAAPNEVNRRIWFHR